VSATALILSALVGHWYCSPTDPGADTQRDVFASDGSGSFTQTHEPHHFTPFRYRLDGPYVIIRMANATLRSRFSLTDFGRTLKDDGYLYWHEGHWVAPSSQTHYTCTRRS
jgi:hypothetical protein